MNQRKIIVNMIGLMLGRVLFLGINPIGIGYFAAAYMFRKGRCLLMPFILAGMATVMPPVDVIKYGIIMLTIMVVISLVERGDRQLSLITMGIISGIITAGITMTKGFVHIDIRYYIVLAVAEGVLVCALTGIFHRGVHYILNEQKSGALDNEEMISMGILMGLIVYSLPRVLIYQISITDMGIYFVILYLGYKYGAGAGAIGGTACAVILGLDQYMLVTPILENNELLSNIGMLSMLGILAGIFRGIGRIGTGIFFGGTAVLLTYISQLDMTSIRIGGIVSSVVLFVLLPKQLIYKEEKETIQSGTQGIDNVNEIGKDKLKDISESFRKLANTFRTIADTKKGLTRKDMNQIFDGVSDKLCKNCSNYSICWQQESYHTHKAVALMLNSAEQNGVIQEKDILKSFSSRCIYLHEFVYETNKEVELAKIDLNWQNRMAESREAIAGQLLEVSNIMNDFSVELFGAVTIEDGREGILTRALAENYIEVYGMRFLEKRNRKHEIHIKARTKKGRCITTKELGQIIGKAYGKKMRPAEGTKNIISREVDTVVYVEDTSFKTLTGIARVAKENEQVSGDNYSFIELDSGEMIMTLSDGMGTGVTACTESESVIELLEQFLEAGFKEESAIKLINSILVLKSEKQSFSTIDMSILNLYTGVCQFVKMGASTTFIKRQGWVETISSTSLPVGVFNQVDFDGISKKLYDGDYIIMVTDGVLDCIKEYDKESYLEDIIMNITSQKPQEIANQILKKALEENRNTPIDDMTVMVAGIWKR